MTPRLKTARGTVLVVSALLCSVAIAGAVGRKNVTLPAGTVITVRLQDPLSSDESRSGESFSTRVDGSNTGLPSGSRIEGVVRKVKPKEGKNPGELDLAFKKVTLPSGKSYSIQGSLFALDNKHVDRDSSGRLVAKKGHKTDRLTYVGYGAGAGLLLSVLTDRKNILRDTAIGGGLGYLIGSLDKSKTKIEDVKLKEGTKLGVRLDSRLIYSSSE